MNNKMTEKLYWENGYKGAGMRMDLPNIDSFRQLPMRRIVSLIERLDLSGKKILEIGAGNSKVLVWLAKRNNNARQFSGLDYTENGCDSLARKAAAHFLNIKVIQADLFSLDGQLPDRHDVIYSIGFVEHFRDLSEVMNTFRCLLSSGGVVVTIIPNIRGVPGFLTRILNRDVYDLHNPHSLFSLRKGHEEAGMKILDSGYLCSTNFGVLSSCVSSKYTVKWFIYISLAIFSRLLWIFEKYTGDLFHSKYVSPYIYVVAKNDT